MLARLKLDEDLINNEAKRSLMLSGLSEFQKILLITDGTVTELLECHIDDGIRIIKLYEELEMTMTDMSDDHCSFLVTDDLPVLRRKVLLQGKSSSKNWLYADSCLLLNNLSTDFRRDLLDSDQPIGKLWAKYRLETYKTIPTVKTEKVDGELASHFNIPVESSILSRTYCVYSHGRQTMIITEKFPTDFFKQ